MRIAILGAGFAGLGACYHLLEASKASVNVDLYDPKPIGHSVSGLSSGLLHPFGGRRARLAWGGERGLDEAHALISAASQATSESFVVAKGILRPALTSAQVADFQQTASEHSEVEWWERERCLKTVAGLQMDLESSGGLFIKRGITLDVPRYLAGLWQACARLGATFVQTAGLTKEKIATYDAVLLAIGHAVTQFPALAELPITTLKGQLLELKWPYDLPPLPFSLIADVHVAMSQDQKSCIVGATYERTFATEGPEPEVAVPELKKRVARFFPKLFEAEVLDVRAGIRAASGGKHLPIIGRLEKKLWYISGMGSKGLLYHGWLGRCVARAILKGSLSYIPEAVRSPLRS